MLTPPAGGIAANGVVAARVSRSRARRAASSWFSSPRRTYVARRIAEGHSKLEAIGCLKRDIAREVFALLQIPSNRPAGAAFCRECRSATLRR